jgi:hypothetical protein
MTRSASHWSRKDATDACDPRHRLSPPAQYVSRPISSVSHTPTADEIALADQVTKGLRRAWAF